MMYDREIMGCRAENPVVADVLRRYQARHTLPSYRSYMMGGAAYCLWRDEWIQECIRRLVPTAERDIKDDWSF